MDPIRKGLIRFVDKTSGAFQMVTQIFGFLPDGRELVRTEEGAAGITVHFSDRSDDGWPPFSITIPRVAEFSNANMGFLTRGAHWTVPETPEDVIDHLTGHNNGFPEPNPGSGGPQKFEWEDGVKVRVVGSDRHNLTLLLVTQERAADAMQEAMTAKLRASRDKWRRP
jgi:hypothetical protein